MSAIPQSRTSTRLRRARAATVCMFLVSGLSLAVWVVSIPAIQHRTALDHALLGTLLLLLGFGSFVGMTATGPLVDRFGSRRLLIATTLLLVVTVNLPGFATDAWSLGTALFLLGLGNGAVDVVINDQAVIVERGYGRPIMSSFHAFFSVGGGAGAAIGAGIQALGLSVSWILGIGALICTLLTIVAYPFLLAEKHASESSRLNQKPVENGSPRSTIALLACFAFVMLLAEGTANDWSALQATERLGVDASDAALAYGSFAVAMTIGRFGGDIIAHRFGPVAIVRAGSIVAIVGMLTVVLSPLYLMTLVGWAVFGIGLSGIAPQIYSAAGNQGGTNQGVIISRVVGAGYLGLLAGPAMIGWLAEGVTLTLALLLAVLCCVIGLLLAARVAPRSRDEDELHTTSL